MSLQALLFDVDGTLADTERDGHRVAFNRAFAQAGLDWDWSVPLYGQLLQITGGKERIRHYLDCFNTQFQRPTNLEEFIATLHKAKTAIYVEMLQGGAIPLRPGVKRLLTEARQAGLRLAIATTTTPDNVTALLQSTLGQEGISWFECIAAGDVVPAKKPAADIYRYVLQRMDLQPTQCIAFEDSENGAKSSAAARIPTVITTNEYTRNQHFNGALLVVDQLGEPQQPFSLKQGEASGYRCVNLALLRELQLRYPVR
ncbi:MAG: HAD family hydrolase [Gammaproteobacteria bacterium]|nr:HAD family hydrolase [Gammaproteobacteria bacterium]